MTRPLQDLPPIPAFAEHEAEVKRLWRQCRWMAIGIFVVCAALAALLLDLGVEPEKAVAISTFVFQAILLSYGMGFFVPSLLTSLKRLGLSVHMMYESLRLGRETVDSMTDLHDRAVPMFDRGDRLIEKMDPVVDKLDRATDDMKAIRERVEKNSEPLPVARRPVLEEAETTPNGEE